MAEALEALAPSAPNPVRLGPLGLTPCAEPTSTTTSRRVGLADALVARAWLVSAGESYELAHQAGLDALAWRWPHRSTAHLAFARPCLDWTERRAAAGALGAAMPLRWLGLGCTTGRTVGSRHRLRGAHGVFGVPEAVLGCWDGRGHTPPRAARA